MDYHVIRSDSQKGTGDEPLPDIPTSLPPPIPDSAPPDLPESVPPVLPSSLPPDCVPSPGNQNAMSSKDGSNQALYHPNLENKSSKIVINSSNNVKEDQFPVSNISVQSEDPRIAGLLSSMLQNYVSESKEKESTQDIISTPVQYVSSKPPSSDFVSTGDRKTIHVSSAPPKSDDIQLSSNRATIVPPSVSSHLVKNSNITGANRLPNDSSNISSNLAIDPKINRTAYAKGGVNDVNSQNEESLKHGIYRPQLETLEKTDLHVMKSGAVPQSDSSTAPHQYHSKTADKKSSMLQGGGDAIPQQQQQQQQHEYTNMSNTKPNISRSTKVVQDTDVLLSEPGMVKNIIDEGKDLMYSKNRSDFVQSQATENNSSDKNDGNMYGLLPSQHSTVVSAGKGSIETPSTCHQYPANHVAGDGSDKVHVGDTVDFLFTTNSPDRKYKTGTHLGPRIEDRKSDLATSLQKPPMTMPSKIEHKEQKQTIKDSSGQEVISNVSVVSEDPRIQSLLSSMLSDYVAENNSESSTSVITSSSPDVIASDQQAPEANESPTSKTQHKSTILLKSRPEPKLHDSREVQHPSNACEVEAATHADYDRQQRNVMNEGADTSNVHSSTSESGKAEAEPNKNTEDMPRIPYQSPTFNKLFGVHGGHTEENVLVSNSNEDLKLLDARHSKGTVNQDQGTPQSSLFPVLSSNTHQVQNIEPSTQPGNSKSLPDVLPKPSKNQLQISSQSAFLDLESKRSEIEPFNVEIQKGIVGLGIKMDVAAHGHVVVSEVNSSDRRAQDIRVGDYVLEVNSTPLTDITKEKLDQTLWLLPTRGLVKLMLSAKEPNKQGKTKTMDTERYVNGSQHLRKDAQGDQTEGNPNKMMSSKKKLGQEPADMCDLGAPTYPRLPPEGDEFPEHMPKCDSVDLQEDQNTKQMPLHNGMEYKGPVLNNGVAVPLSLNTDENIDTEVSLPLSPKAQSLSSSGSRRSSLGSDTSSEVGSSKGLSSKPRKESLVDSLERKRRETMGVKLKGLQIPSRKTSNSNQGTNVVALPTISSKPQTTLAPSDSKRRTSYHGLTPFKATASTYKPVSINLASKSASVDAGLRNHPLVATEQHSFHADIKTHEPSDVKAEPDTGVPPVPTEPPPPIPTSAPPVESSTHISVTPPPTPDAAESKKLSTPTLPENASDYLKHGHMNGNSPLDSNEIKPTKVLRKVDVDFGTALLENTKPESLSPVQIPTPSDIPLSLQSPEHSPVKEERLQNICNEKMLPTLPIEKLDLIDPEQQSMKEVPLNHMVQDNHAPPVVKPKPPKPAKPAKPFLPPKPQLKPKPSKSNDKASDKELQKQQSIEEPITKHVELSVNANISSVNTIASHPSDAPRPFRRLSSRDSIEISNDFDMAPAPPLSSERKFSLGQSSVREGPKPFLPVSPSSEEPPKLINQTAPKMNIDASKKILQSNGTEEAAKTTLKSPTSPGRPSIPPPPVPDQKEKKTSVDISTDLLSRTSTTLVGPSPASRILPVYDSKKVDKEEVDVTLQKGATGLGFCIMGGIGSPLGDRPISVKRLYKGGAASTGLLLPGDEIVEANGKALSNMSHYVAWNYLKSLPEGNLLLKIHRRK